MPHEHSKRARINIEGGPSGPAEENGEATRQSSDQPGPQSSARRDPSTAGSEAPEEPSPAQPAPAFPAEDQRDPERVRKLEAEKQALMNTLVRRQADFENYRKRLERERHDDRRRGVSMLLEHLLPVLDDFERALQAHKDPAYEEYRRGLELIYRRLWSVMSREGLERIEAAGKTFDPHYHEAIERVPTAELPEGTVIEELQPGYIFHGKVLRAAMVRVAASPAD